MESLPSLPSVKNILRRVGLATPLLFVMGCVRAETEAVGQWIDHDATTFDIKIETDETVGDIPYSLLALMQGGDEIDTEGHEDFKLPIRLDSSVSEEERYDLDAQAFSVLYVNPTEWCGEVMKGLSMYNLFVTGDGGCVNDEANCEAQVCDEEALEEEYLEIVSPPEEEDTTESI